MSIVVSLNEGVGDLKDNKKVLKFLQEDFKEQRKTLETIQITLARLDERSSETDRILERQALWNTLAIGAMVHFHHKKSK